MKWEDSESTFGETALEAYRWGGNTLNTVFEEIGEAGDFALDAVFPAGKLVRPAVEAATAKGMEALGIPGMLSQWEEASPDSFENAKAGMGYLQAIPAIRGATKIIPKTVNAGTDNLATRLDGSDIHGNNPTNSGGFYGGDPFGGIAQGYNFQEHLRQLFDPQAIANKERTGIGQHRIDEYNLSSQNRAPGNARASLYMHEAKNRGEPTGALIESLPAATDNIRGTVRAGDTGGLTRLLTSDLPEGHQLPDHVRDRFIDKEREVLGGRQGKEKWIAQLFQGGRGVPDPDRAIVKVNDPTAAWSELSREASGKGASGSSVGKALANPNILNSAEKAFGKPNSQWKKEEWMEYYNSMAMFERGNWRGTKAGRAKLKAQPWFKKLPEKVQQRVLKLGGMDKDIEGLKSVTGVDMPAEAMQVYWKAKTAANTDAQKLREWERLEAEEPLYYQKNTKNAKKGDRKPRPKPSSTLTNRQQRTLDVVDQYKAAQGNRVDYTVAEDGTEFIDYRSSWLSKDQALGGVGGRYSHDITNNKVYSNGTDGHDMMGADPVGADQLWNMTPIQVYTPGETPTPKNRRQSEDPVWQQAMKDFEEKSGIPKNKGESDEAYQKRVLSMDADVKARHYAEPIVDTAASMSVLTNPLPSASTGGNGMMNQVTAGGLPVGLMNAEEQEKQRLLRQGLTGNVRGENAKPFYS